MGRQKWGVVRQLTKGIQKDNMILIRGIIMYESTKIWSRKEIKQKGSKFLGGSH